MGSLAWKVLGPGAALLAAAAANRLVVVGWKAASGKAAPTDPAHPEDSSWKEAILFAAISGFVVQAARVAAQRKAAEYYARSAGHLPQALEHD